MEQAYKQVIDRLYKPLAGQRQAFAMSRASAEKIPFLPSIAVISITAPERPEAKLAPFNSMLRLSFTDVDFLNPEISKRAKEKVRQSFSLEQADQICAFIESLPSEISSVVVHCEGGYSRSTAVVQALHDLYGFHIDATTVQEANPSVLQLLLRVGQQRRRKS